MKAFSLKKPEVKRQIAVLKEDKPLAKLLDAVLDQEEVKPADSTLTRKKSTLIIPCTHPLSTTAPTNSTTTPAAIPTIAGLHVPEEVSDLKISDRPSVLLGLKRVIEDDGESEISDSEDYAWGLLRGMGWQGEPESEISKFPSKNK